MAKLPRKVNKGEVIKGQHYNDLIDYINAMKPVGGKNILVSHTSGGSTISWQKTVRSSVGEEAESVTFCKLTAKVDDNTYTGDIYANGQNQAATLEDETIRVAGTVAVDAEIPNYTTHFFVVWQAKWTVGGSTYSQWTISPARVL